MVSGPSKEEVEEEPGPPTDVPDHGPLFYGGTVPGPDCPATPPVGELNTCEATVPFKNGKVPDLTMNVLSEASVV